MECLSMNDTGIMCFYSANANFEAFWWIQCELLVWRIFVRKHFRRNVQVLEMILKCHRQQMEYGP